MMNVTKYDGRFDTIFKYLVSVAYETDCYTGIESRRTMQDKGVA